MAAPSGNNCSQPTFPAAVKIYRRRLVKLFWSSSTFRRTEGESDCGGEEDRQFIFLIYCGDSILFDPMEAVEKSKETIPGNSSRLAGNPNWGTATVVGIFAGMLYGGSKEASASVSKDAEVMLKMGSTQDKREQHRLMRDAMEKRFTRVTRGSLIGGMRLGMFTASYFSLQNFLAETRGVHDVFNFVGAGSATAAVFGLIMPGSLGWRARNVMLGSVLGATVCFPLGWLQLKLMEKANEGKKEDTSHHGEVTSGVGAAIERLEQQLRK